MLAQQRIQLNNLELPMALRMDSDKASKILKDLKRAASNVRQVIQELDEIQLDGDFERNIKEFWYKLNCYSLTNTDCAWADVDVALQQVFDSIFLCYRTLVSKSRYKVSDLIYARKVLDTAEETFTAVIEELEQNLMI